MFERFTDRARRVVVLSQEAARELGHNYIGTEHVLLGVIEEGEGIGAQALGELGIESDAVREGIIAIVGLGKPGAEQGGHIPFTPRCKKVLELALREALQLGHNYIGTEHILLGLMREGEGVAARVLSAQGVELERLRQTVVDLGDDAPLAPFEPSRGASGRTFRASAGFGARLDAIEARLARIEELLVRLTDEPPSETSPDPSPGASPDSSPAASTEASTEASPDENLGGSDSA